MVGNAGSPPGHCGVTAGSASDLAGSSPIRHLAVIGEAQIQLMNLSRRQLLTATAADFPNQPPSGGNQFFGHVAIDPRSEVFTVSLRNLYGEVLWRKDLNPDGRH